jgi:glycosyltransferase involved in cell wall biosynthesis
MGQKISIIIPAFNMERFIEQAVQSAVEQDGISLSDLEILAVNDGSEDSTGHIVEGLIKKYGGFIRLISLKSNAGVLTAVGRQDDFCC